MSNEELAAAIAAGDSSLAGELWENCRDFIKMQARKYFTRNEALCRCELEDLCQCGYFAILESAATFNSEAGYSFISWLDYYLLKHFRQCAELRTTRQRSQALFEARALRLDAPIAGEDDDILLEDAAPDERAEAEFIAVEESIYTEQLHTALDNYIDDTLSDRQADVVRGRYWNGRTQSEIAEDKGLSPQRVSDVERQSLRKMRDDFKTEKGGRLQGFVNEHVNAYSGTGLSAFLTAGKRQTEELAMRRMLFEKIGRERFGLDDRVDSPGAAPKRKDG